MQIPLGTLELQYPVGHRDGSTLWSDSPAGSTEKFKGATSPSARQRRSRSRSIIRTVFSALLALVLAAYFCHSPRGLRGSDYRLLRRLASSDEDETCKDLLELIGNISREDTGESSTSQEPAQTAGPSRESVSRKRPRKRGPSRGGQDAGAKLAKKSLFEGAAQALGGDDHQSIDALPRPSSDQSSTQRQTDSFLEYPFSGGPHGPDEASAASVTEKLETAPHGAESVADADLIDTFLTEEDLVDQWFLDFILDSTSTSLAGSGLEDVQSTKELAGEVEAKPGDQVTPISSSSSEGQSPAAPGSTSGDAQLPVFDAQAVQGSTALSESPSEAPSFLYFSAPPSTFYTAWTSKGQRLQSTCQVQAPEPSSANIPAGKKALTEHPFFRLPTAEISDKIIPFSMARATMYTRRSKFSVVLASIRELLIKPHLGPDATQSLILLAEKLVKIIFSMGNFSQAIIPLWEVYEPVARRFLLADALWSVCEVVGPPMLMEEWWKVVMDKLVLLPNTKVTQRQMQTTRFQTIRRMIAALHIYRQGRRPSAQEVVELKREIFCSPGNPTLFRSRELEKFREDAAQ